VGNLKLPTLPRGNFLSPTDFAGFFPLYFIVVTPLTTYAKIVCYTLARIAGAVWVAALVVVVLHRNCITHVLIKKLMGCAFSTAEPAAALAVTAVPRENPEPTPTGKYVL
jgi:hypothetical protein